MGTLIAGVALSYLAGKLLSPEIPKPEVDESSPIFSKRGSYVPWIMGRRRVGHVVAWVGSRRVEEREEGGGKGGGGGGAKYNVYYEKAWHLICTGPVQALHAIYRSGEEEENLLPEGGINRDDYPSGSYIDLGSGSGFWIYWGECDQPVNLELANLLPDSPASAWPGCCYVLWDDYYLGQITSWPRIEYDVEVVLTTDMSPLADSAPYLLGGGEISAPGWSGLDADGFSPQRRIDADDVNLEIDSYSAPEIVLSNGGRDAAYNWSTDPMASAHTPHVVAKGHRSFSGPTDQVFQFELEVVAAPSSLAVFYGVLGSEDMDAISYSELLAWKNQSAVSVVGKIISICVSYQASTNQVFVGVGENAAPSTFSGANWDQDLVPYTQFSPMVRWQQTGRQTIRLNTTGPFQYPVPGAAAWSDSRPTLTVESDNTGANPAHVLYYLHTAHYPFGSDSPPEQLDEGAYDLLGVQCEAQHLPINCLAADGQTCDQLISDILSDIGIALPYVEGLLRPILQREESSALTLTDDLVDQDTIERTISVEKTSIERMIYQFSDRANAFAVQDLAIEDDSGDAVRGKRSERQVGLPTLTSFQAATWAVDRKQREAILGGDSIFFTGMREAARYQSGEALILPSGLQVRVVQAKYYPLEDAADLECIIDIYAAQSTSPIQNDPARPQLPTRVAPEPDEFLWLEATRSLGRDLGELTVWRAKTAADVAGASVHVSQDDAAYSFAEAASASTVVGYIIDPITATDDADLSSGPKFRILAGSASLFRDLTGSSSLLEAGEQQILIGDEIFYLESVTVLGNGGYQFGLMKRGRNGTTTSGHPAFSLFALGLQGTIVVNSNAVVQADTTLYVKTQPYTIEQTLDLSATDPRSDYVYGAAEAPLPPVDVSVNSATDRWTAGADVVVDFTCEESIPELASSVARDAFELKIYDADRTTVLRTIDASSPAVGANSITYTNAQIVTDFGSEPGYIYLRLVAKSGTYRSLPVFLEIAKDSNPRRLDNDRIFQVQAFGLESGYFDEQDAYRALGAL